MQVWCLVRNFPLLLFDKIKDVNDDVWALVLCLRRIVDVVCARKISDDQIEYLRYLIDEYLDLRTSCFDDNLIPKHHFLEHYPELIRMYGPLINVWAMRFESKHSYFKKVIQTTQNFKNVTKMLSNRHQLLQAYLAQGSRLPEDIVADNLAPINFNLLSSDILTAIKACGLIMPYSCTMPYQLHDI